jgi:hypothetical protein
VLSALHFLLASADRLLKRNNEAIFAGAPASGRRLPLQKRDHPFDFTVQRSKRRAPDDP